MSKYTVIAVLISLLWVYLGAVTIINDYRSRINILFSLLCLTMITWNFSGGVAYSISGMETFRLASRISFIGFFLFFPVNLHFYLAVSKTVIKPLYLLLNYMAGAIVAVIQFMTFFLFSEIVKYGNEWTGIINYGSPWIYISILYLAAYSMFSFAILLRWRASAGSRKERIYSVFMLVFFNFANVVTAVFTFMLPMFHIYILQFTGFALFNLYVFGLYFLVARFRFMNLGSPLMAEELISSINDLVFILDRDFRITGVNKKNKPFFFSGISRIRNMDFFEIIKENQDLRNRLDNLRLGREANFIIPVNYKTDSGYLLTSSYFSGIVDKFGDRTGYIVISNEIREVKQFQKKYRITSREMEIIEHTITGLSYPEISRKLSISERTVERHLTNIYNKLGINNKIELYRITGEYNINL